MIEGLAMPRPTNKVYSPLIEEEADEKRRSTSSLNSTSSPTFPPMMAFEDGMTFLSFAARALSKDEFSKCFEPKPTGTPLKGSLRYWVYVIGVGIRYGIIFPFRLGIFATATIIFLICLFIMTIWRNQNMTKVIFRTYCRVWLFAFGARIRHHGKKPNLKEPHLFVANHTSFIDFFLISSHIYPHATVAQEHGGIFGWFQRHALNLNGSLFFNRNEHKDRVALSRKMQAHINNPKQISPLIIFPEGTCVNNESTVLFHKGAFEMDGLICPIAIKYNKRLLDPYWNSREQTFTQHVLYLMTRWIMVADVWWLPPQRRGSGEGAIEFSRRVKRMVSDTAGLKNLSWDGYMKNCMRKQDEEKMRKTYQEKYVSSLRRRITPAPSEACLNVQASMSSSELPRSKSRSISLNLDSSMEFGKSLPNDRENYNAQIPYIPSWLPDHTIVDIKNELLLAQSNANHSQGLIQHMRESNTGLIKTWKYYSRFNGDKLSDRRIENSSWRLWFKQHLEEEEQKQETINSDDNNQNLEFQLEFES